MDVVGQFVQLKKAGRNYMGLCPFHAEKAPSFTVSPERQMFHCFGCKKGGDIFAFWMAYHSSTFPEALRELAGRYQVTITDAAFSPAERKQAALREALLEANEKAAIFFQKTLADSVKGRPARAYLKERKLTKTIVNDFRLGYAPEEWNALTRFLKTEGVDPEVAVKAGLIVPKKNSGHYDRFRGRIIFPILNPGRRVVGFGGRVLGDALPKYLNTPETPLFRKSELLYGLHASFKSIREKGRAVLVEGYMDLLALYKEGLREIAATLGTALTAEHVRKLKGYTQEVALVFDSDAAGKAAALRSLPLFLNADVTAKSVVLPEGHDPDTFVNAEGAAGFKELLEQALPMFDFYLEQKVPPQDSDVEGQVRVLKEILPTLAALRNRPQQALYVRRLCERIGIKEEVVWGELQTMAGKGAGTLKARLESSKVGKHFGSDLHLLNLLVHYPQTVGKLKDCDWQALVGDPGVREIVKSFFNQYAQQGSVRPEDSIESLSDEAARQQLREALLQPPFYTAEAVELAVTEFVEKTCRMEISASIRKAKELGDIESLNRLLKLKAQNARK